MSEEQTQACVIELHYLPCIQYVQLFFQYDEIHLEQYEHYQKRSYRNRAKILSPQGVQLLSVPLLKGKHQQMPITEVRIAYHTPWYAQHWHAIQTAYGSAPYFIHYGDDIKNILYSKPDTLYELNLTMLNWIISHVHAPARITETQTYQLNYQGELHDLRNSIKPGFKHETAAYPQVFTDRLGFIENLSALDLLMHLGPESYQYLSRHSISS
jgi:hypothetical protein